MFTNYFDSHVHTHNSPNSKHSVSYLCESAINKGLIGFAVTDHFECDLSEQRYDLVIKNSVMDIKKAQISFADQLTLTCGIEIGQPLMNLTACNDILSFTKYDYVIASLHRDSMHENHYVNTNFNDFSKKDIDLLVSTYFDDMLKTVEWAGFDVVGHFTYPSSLIEGVYKKIVDMTAYDEVVDEILKKIVQKGKGIEINTSGLRYDLNRCIPSIQYIKRFKELGGELVTIGSDAHSAEELGEGIQKGMEMLKYLGFEYVTMYQQHQPRMLKIE
ncbi:MAG: histidinol-phosphatase HisJ family protein [Oscillospiraceae bacterium]